MHVAIVEVEKLLHGSSVYQVPHFQRAYSWGPKQWARLWADLLAIAGDTTTRKHFLGPLVCRQLPRGPGDSIGRFEVIDGQQRLTTISILLGAMRDHARSQGRDDLAAQIHEDYLVHHRRHGSERFKLVPRVQDRRVWNALVERAGSAEMPASVASVIDDAWAWLLGRVGSLRLLGEGETPDPEDPDFASVLEAVVQRLAFVSITIDDDNPYRVFESLNTTGLALTEFDLVRNHLFMRVAIDDQERFENDAWSHFEQMWSDAVDAGGGAEKVATRFLHHFLMRIDGPFRRGDIYLRFQKWAEGQFADGGADSYEVVRTLSRFARYAGRLREAERIRSRRAKGEGGADWPTDPIDQALLRIAYCDAGSATPLILELFDLEERQALSSEELALCLQDLASFFVRRSIARVSAKNYNNLMAEIPRRLQPPYRESLWAECHRSGWPSDEACLAAVLRHSIYTSDPGKARLILEEIERRHGSREPVQLARLQLEHILPQTLSGEGESAWREALGDDHEALHAEIVDTLGNLTLTGWNSELSNHAFDRKRREYAGSPLTLNAALATHERWTPEAIEARSRELLTEFLSIFPRHGTPVAVRRVGRRGARRGADRGDRNRRFWQLFLSAVEDATGGRLHVVVGSNPFITGHTRFESIALMPWIELHRQRFGIWVQFNGAGGVAAFERLRPHLDRVRSALGVEFKIGFNRSGRARIELPPAIVSGGDAVEDATIAAALAERFVATEAGLSEVLSDLAFKVRRVFRSCDNLRHRWNRSLHAVALERTQLHARSAIGYGRGMYASAGFNGAYLEYAMTKKACRVQLKIGRRAGDPEAYLRRFDAIARHAAAIEAAVGPLEWIRDRNGSRSLIAQTLPGGAGSPESEWPEIQRRLVDAMIGLHAALEPVIEAEGLRDGG